MKLHKGKALIFTIRDSIDSAQEVTLTTRDVERGRFLKTLERKGNVFNIFDIGDGWLAAQNKKNIRNPKRKRNPDELERILRIIRINLEDEESAVKRSYLRGKIDGITIARKILSQ